MVEHSLEGGCICGACRYKINGTPAQIVLCHCRFCQKATGTTFMKEPIYEANQLSMVEGVAERHSIVSRGSGKRVHIHFCKSCGTKLYLGFERFEGWIGLYAGTLDSPDMLEIAPEKICAIFLDEAQYGTVIPAGVRTYRQHQITSDGRPVQPVIYDTPQVITRD